MSEFRVLMLYPNLQSETLVPPSLALFSALMKREGFKVDLFDTTNYEMRTDLARSGRTDMTNLNVAPYMITQKVKIGNVYEDFRKRIEMFGPDLILVTATENMFPEAIDLLNHVDDLNVPVILGGVFATFAGDLAMRWKEIDILCVGEGENVLIELCRKMSRGEDFSAVLGLWIRQKDGSIKKNPLGPRVNMDENPLPDFSIFEDSRFYRPMAGKTYRMFPIETHRGCPYACRFCNSPAQDKLYRVMTGQMFFRKKSFPAIREELLYCRDVWKAEYFFFWADTFFAWSEKEFDEFCEIYKDIKIPFWCQTRPETVVKQRLEKLKGVGVNRMGFGIEHGNEQYRRDVIGRAFSNELAINRMKIVSDLGIQFGIHNIIGFPDETKKLVFDTIELNRCIASHTFSCSIFVPFHGTELGKMAVERGYIHPDAICPTNSDDSILTMPPPFLSKEQIRALRRVFAMYVRFPKERWPEIKQAEALTPEGDRIWEELRDEFIQTFFSHPDGDIEKISITA